jgi:hypothetical protein
VSWYRTEADMVDHPKVFRLAELLNNPCAGWYYVRLLAWTSRYAARGRLRDVTFGALENACGWRGEAGALLNALITVGLVDELEDQDDGATLEVHDWWEIQRQYVVKAEKDAERKRAERSRRASVTRTGAVTSHGPSIGRHADGHADVPRDGAGTRRDDTRRDETGEEAPQPPADLPAPESAKPHPLQATWNKHRSPSLPEWRETSKTRRAQADARLKERPLEGPAGWVAVVQRLARSPFANGVNDRAWRASPDWLLRPDTAAKVLEGKYDSAPAARASAPNAPDLHVGGRPTTAATCCVCGAPAVGEVWGSRVCADHVEAWDRQPPLSDRSSAAMARTAQEFFASIRRTTTQEATP